MSRRLPSALLLVSFALAAPVLAAQDEAGPPLPEPAQELRVFEPRLGHWEGAGKVFMAPEDAAGMPWTATIDASWAVGGHAVLEVMRVDGGDAFPAMEWITLHSWNADESELRQVGVGTMGGYGEVDSVFVLDGGTIVSCWSGMDMGTPVIDQSISSLADGVMTIRVNRAIGSGPAFLHVDGKFKRTEGDKGTVDAAATPARELHANLAGLKPMVGHWNIEGTWRETLESPAMQIAGHDRIVPIAGGMGLYVESHGGMQEGGPLFYEGIALLGWDEAKGKVRQCFVDNMGVSGTTELHVMDGKVVSAMTGTAQGTPFADVSEMHFKDGKLAGVQSHRMTGGQAFLAFQGKYSPRK